MRAGVEVWNSGALEARCRCVDMEVRDLEVWMLDEGVSMRSHAAAELRRRAAGAQTWRHIALGFRSRAERVASWRRAASVSTRRYGCMEFWRRAAVEVWRVLEARAAGL